MLFFINSFVFLLSISLSTLVIPSIVPKISLLTSFLLLGAIFLNSMFPTGFINPHSNLNRIRSSSIGFETIHFPFLVIILLSIWVFLRYFELGVSPLSDMNLIALHVLFLFFIFLTKHSLTLYLKVYIYFVFLMAAFALFANALFLLNIINPQEHQVNISILTNGAFTRDQLFLESYTFPYGLGFILTGDGQLNILGKGFYRISGWAHEPTSATLFISPAILLLLHGEIIKWGFVRFVMISFIGAFWFLALSVGSMLAFLVLYGSVVLVYFYQHFFQKNKTMVVIFIVTILLIPLILVYFQPVIQSTLFSSKFNLESHTLNTALNQLTWFLPDSDKRVISYLSSLALWVIIFTFLFSTIYFLVNGRNNKVYSLVVFYIIIHSMKGSQTTVFYLLFSYFWLYVAYFSSIEKIESY